MENDNENERLNEDNKNSINTTANKISILGNVK